MNYLPVLSPWQIKLQHVASRQEQIQIFRPCTNMDSMYAGPLSNYIYCHWCVAIVQMYGPSVEYQHRNTMYNKPLKVIGMYLP